MIFFRTDSNDEISGGHLIRSVAVAKAFYRRGESILFLVADDCSISVIKDHGFDYLILNSDWRDLMTDAEQTLRLLKENKPSLLFIDTYSVSKRYVEYLKPYSKIAYLGSIRKYIGDVDFLINYSTDIDYNFYKEKYNKDTQLLLGPSYAPLREEFQNIEHIYKNKITDVLITTGNTDPFHVIPTILKHLINGDDGNIIFHVVIGRLFNNVAYFHEEYDNNDKVVLHENVECMSILMNKCDIAITANGTTVYELAAIGLPIISFALVKEQVNSAKALKNLEVIDYCGEVFEDQDHCIENIKKRYMYYLNNNDELISLAKKAHDLIDGNGSQKIVDAISFGWVENKCL